MIMAWLKLRRRNIAPLLNANGWAVNAASKISIPFGETLTSVAKYPKMRLKDPYAKSSIPAFAKVLISLACLAVVAAGLWIFNLLSFAGLESPLPRYNKAEVEAEIVEAADTAAVADTVVLDAEPVVVG